jgi:hypothetical protein
LAQFSTLAVAADTLALLAAASFVPIEGTLIEQLRHLIRVEIDFADFASQKEVASERLLLEEKGLRPHQQQ